MLIKQKFRCSTSEYDQNREICTNVPTENSCIKKPDNIYKTIF